MDFQLFTLCYSLHLPISSSSSVPPAIWEARPAPSWGKCRDDLILQNEASFSFRLSFSHSHGQQKGKTHRVVGPVPVQRSRDNKNPASLKTSQALLHTCQLTSCPCRITTRQPFLILWSPVHNTSPLRKLSLLPVQLAASGLSSQHHLRVLLQTAPHGPDGLRQSPPELPQPHEGSAQEYYK